MAAPKRSPSKYTEARVETILRVIRETGCVTAAWKAIGINKTTYYRWLEAHPPLVAKVAAAFDDFQRNAEAEHKEAAMKKLLSYLHGKEKLSNSYDIEKKEAVLGRDGKPILDENNNPVFKTILEKKKVTTSVPTPQWVIERFLGRRLPLGDAIATFTSYGYTVTQTETGFVMTDGYTDGVGEDEPSATTDED